MAGSPQSLYETPLSVVFPRYTIEGKLAAGPGSLVLRARQHSPFRTVAIKILAKELCQDADALERFEREGRAAASLSHPHFVEIYEQGIYAGTPYLVMEFLDGGDLGTAITEGPLETAEVLRIGVAIARALEHTHERGMVHRDVKPANVLLGNDGRVKLTDLGMAKMQDAREQGLTTRDTCMGTPEFMAPEQVEDFGNVTPAADVYSTGATLYQALYGHSPFADISVVRQLRKTLRARPSFPERPGIPDGVVELLKVCLAKNPRKRYQHGGQLLTNLKRVRVGRPPRVPGARAALQARWKLALLAGGLTLAALVVGWFAW